MPRSGRRTAETNGSDLAASVAQFRSDEGTPHLSAGITNDSGRAVRVTTATIRWGGLSFPVVKLDGEPVPPGQTAAVKISYQAAGCREELPAAPVMVATVDGRATRLRLHQDDPTLFRRLHVTACARQRLDEVATVRLAAGSLVHTGGGYVLPASIVLRRRPGSTVLLRLVDVGGSVLLTLAADGGRSALPAVLRSGQQVLRIPVRFGSTHRCDGHALGQSQQTFLLSAYLRLPGDPTQRQILALTKRDLAALQAVIDRSCHPTG